MYVRPLNLGNPRTFEIPNWHRDSQTNRMAFLREVAENSGRDPRVAHLAVQILKASGVQPRQYKEQAQALLKWVQTNIYYVNEPNERLQDPLYTVKVGYKITEGERTRIQNYEGVVIARKGGSTLSASFTVRKISFGEGVERVFPLYSTNIESITVLRRGRVRRSKLYYLRGLRGKSARIAEKTNYKNEISDSTKTKG